MEKNVCVHICAHAYHIDKIGTTCAIFHMYTKGNSLLEVVDDQPEGKRANKVRRDIDIFAMK